MDKRLSDYEIEERAASARAFLNDPVIKEAFDSMHSRYMGTLLASDVGSLTATAAHAKLAALADFQAELISVITEKKIRDKHIKVDNG